MSNGLIIFIGVCVLGYVLFDTYLQNRRKKIFMKIVTEFTNNTWKSYWDQKAWEKVVHRVHVLGNIPKVGDPLVKNTTRMEIWGLQKHFMSLIRSTESELVTEKCLESMLCLFSVFTEDLHSAFWVRNMWGGISPKTFATWLVESEK